MDRADVGNSVTITFSGLQEECTEVWLTSSKHILHCGYDSGVPDNNSFIKAREEWSSSNRESKDLWVYFRDRQFRDG
jgi:hypothetical protein